LKSEEIQFGNKIVIKFLITIIFHTVSGEYVTHHSQFIPEEVAETSQMFLRDTRIIPKLLSYEKYFRRDR
jgi:hypothetical protein